MTRHRKAVQAVRGIDALGRKHLGEQGQVLQRSRIVTARGEVPAVGTEGGAKHPVAIFESGTGRLTRFDVTADGLGASTYNVGANGAAFGVAGALHHLPGTDSLAVNDVVRNCDLALSRQALNVFGGIKSLGSSSISIGRALDSTKLER